MEEVLRIDSLIGQVPCIVYFYHRKERYGILEIAEGYTLRFNANIASTSLLYRMDRKNFDPIPSQATLEAVDEVIELTSVTDTHLGVVTVTNPDPCPICFVPNMCSRVTSCGHSICASCYPHLVQAANTTCPICRSLLT